MLPSAPAQAYQTCVPIQRDFQHCGFDSLDPSTSSGVETVQAVRELRGTPPGRPACVHGTIQHGIQQRVKVLRTTLAQAPCTQRQVQVQRPLTAQAQCIHPLAQEQRKPPRCTPRRTQELRKTLEVLARCTPPLALVFRTRLVLVSAARNSS